MSEDEIEWPCRNKVSKVVEARELSTTAKGISAIHAFDSTDTCTCTCTV